MCVCVCICVLTKMVPSMGRGDFDAKITLNLYTNNKQYTTKLLNIKWKKNLLLNLLLFISTIYFTPNTTDKTFKLRNTWSEMKFTRNIFNLETVFEALRCFSLLLLLFYSVFSSSSLCCILCGDGERLLGQNNLERKEAEKFRFIFSLSLCDARINANWRRNFN